MKEYDLKALFPLPPAPPFSDIGDVKIDHAIIRGLPEHFSHERLIEDISATAPYLIDSYFEILSPTNGVELFLTGQVNVAGATQTIQVAILNEFYRCKENPDDYDLEITMDIFKPQPPAPEGRDGPLF